MKKLRLCALLLALCLSLCAAAPSLTNGTVSASEGKGQIGATVTTKDADAASTTPATPATPDTDATAKDKDVGSATPAASPLVASTAIVAMDKFGDVSPDSILGGEVILAAAKGFVKGYSDGNFHPNDPVSVRAFLIMISRTFSSVDYTPALATGEEWPDAIALLFERILSETDLDAACDFIKAAIEPATRGDAAHLMSLVSGAKRSDYEGRSDAPFDDLSTEEQYWADSVNGSRYNRPVITGYRDNTARFGNTLTRAEAAALINRLASQRVDQMAKGGQTATVFNVQRIPPDRSFENVYYDLAAETSSWKTPKALATAGLYLFGSGYEVNIYTIGKEEVVCAAKRGAAVDSCFVVLRLNSLGQAKLTMPATQKTFATTRGFVSWVDEVTEPYEAVSKITKDALAGETREALRRQLDEASWEDVSLSEFARYAVACGLYNVSTSRIKNGDGTYTERLNGVTGGTHLVLTKGYPHLGDGEHDTFFCLYAIGEIANTAPEKLETPSDGAKLLEWLCKV